MDTFFPGGSYYKALPYSRPRGSIGKTENVAIKIILPILWKKTSSNVRTSAKNKAVECLSRKLYLLWITLKGQGLIFVSILLKSKITLEEELTFLKFFCPFWLFLIQFDDVDVNTFVITSKPNKFDIRDLSKHDNQGNTKISKVP